MNLPTNLAALALACAVAGANATETSRLEEVVVTSSRVAMPLREVGTSVSVLTLEEIRASGFNALFDVLRTTPAVAVSNTGGAGQPTALRIRGEEGFRTRVYIDGIDVADTAGPQVSPRFEEILSSGVQRVEVLRGPQGLMYGADAGGIVNISTRSPGAGLRGDVSVEAGRYGTRQLAANAAGGSEILDFSLAATDFETAGFNARATDDVLRDDDGYDNATFHGRAGWNINRDLRLEAVARDTSSHSDYDDCFTADTFAPSDRCSSDFEQRAWRVSAQYQHGHFDHQLAYSGNSTEREAEAEGRPTFSSAGELERYSYLGSFRAGPALRLVYGVDLLSESIDDGSFDRERDQQGYYLEYQGGFGDRLFVTAGGRYDDNEDFGTYTTYRVSAAYLIPSAGGETKIRAAYGTGFRAPSLYEITYNDSWGFPPATDAALTAEESEGYDVGIAWYGDSGLYLEAVYFDQTVLDEIYFDLLNFSGYLQGRGDTGSRGVELIAEQTFFRTLTVSANYTYNDTESASGAARLRRPRHLANAGVDWQMPGGAVTLGAHVRAAADAEGVGGVALDDYQVVDINASYRFANGLAVYGRLENLLDEDYREVPNYNTAGAAAYAGVRYSF
jgi:vitamin B12 transporter